MTPTNSLQSFAEVQSHDTTLGESFHESLLAYAIASAMELRRPSSELRMAKSRHVQLTAKLQLAQKLAAAPQNVEVDSMSNCPC